MQIKSTFASSLVSAYLFGDPSLTPIRERIESDYICCGMPQKERSMFIIEFMISLLFYDSLRCRISLLGRASCIHMNMRHRVSSTRQSIHHSQSGIRTHRGRVSSVIRPALYLQATTAGFKIWFVLL